MKDFRVSLQKTKGRKCITRVSSFYLSFYHNQLQIKNTLTTCESACRYSKVLSKVCEACLFLFDLHGELSSKRKLHARGDLEWVKGKKKYHHCRIRVNCENVFFLNINQTNENSKLYHALMFHEERVNICYKL